MIERIMMSGIECDGLVFIYVDGVIPSYELNLSSAKYAITQKDSKWIATKILPQTGGTTWIYPEKICIGDSPYECVKGVAQYIVNKLKEKKQ